MHVDGDDRGVPGKSERAAPFGGLLVHAHQATDWLVDTDREHGVPIGPVRDDPRRGQLGAKGYYVCDGCHRSSGADILGLLLLLVLRAGRVVCHRVDPSHDHRDPGAAGLVDPGRPDRRLKAARCPGIVTESADASQHPVFASPCDGIPPGPADLGDTPTLPGDGPTANVPDSDRRLSPGMEMMASSVFPAYKLPTGRIAARATHLHPCHRPYYRGLQ